MASRWIRWHQTSHIWEYSTDNGSNWAPLPLNAAIINEGTISPARLPPTVPVTGGDNTWTGTNIISNVQPTLIFNETDQGVNLKRTRFVVASGILYLQTQNDAGADLANLLAIGRSGAINAAATENHIFTITKSGPTAFTISNPDAGVTTYTDIVIANNLGNRFYMRAFSSNWVDRCDLQCLASNLLIGSVNQIEFYTQGTVKAYIDASGNMVVSPGYIYAHAGLVTYGQPGVLGNWINVPFNAADFTATVGSFTVTPGNIQAFRYCYIGKTILLHLSIATATLTAATQAAIIKIPFVPQSSMSFMSTIYNGTSWQSAYTTMTAGQQTIAVYGSAAAGAWPAVSGAVYINFDLSFPIL